MAGTKKKAVAVLGASGYAGAEMLRLLALHPGLEVVAATAASKEGAAVADLYPSLAADYGRLRLGPTDAGGRPRGPTSCSAPCLTGPPRPSWPTCWPGPATWSTWPPTSA